MKPHILLFQSSLFKPNLPLLSLLLQLNSPLLTLSSSPPPVTSPPWARSAYGKDPPVTPLLPSSLARSTTELTCDHRLYQGYTLRPGDRTLIKLAPSFFSSGASMPSAVLCLWKFFPTESCRISLSCPHFSIASKAPFVCQGKLITKVGVRSAKQWCGRSRPPPLRTTGSLLVGYMALSRTSSTAPSRDAFTCSLSCKKKTSIAGSLKDPDRSCYCGLANQQRQTRRKKKQQSRAKKKQQSRGKQKQRRKQSGQRKKYSWRNLALDFVNPDQENPSSKSKNPGQEKLSSKSKQRAAPFSSMNSTSPTPPCRQSARSSPTPPCRQSVESSEELLLRRALCPGRQV